MHQLRGVAAAVEGNSGRVETWRRFGTIGWSMMNQMVNGQALYLVLALVLAQVPCVPVVHSIHVHSMEYVVSLLFTNVV